VPGDGRIDQLLEVRSEVLVGAFLVRFHQARIARHVSGEDRGKTASRGHGSGWPTCFEGLASAIIHRGSSGGARLVGDRRGTYRMRFLWPDGCAYVADYGAVRDNGQSDPLSKFQVAGDGPLVQFPGTGVSSPDPVSAPSLLKPKDGE
jgi:hypothetical protein